MPLLIPLLVSLVYAVEAPTVVEEISIHSQIDWTEMRIEAVGKAGVMTNAANYSHAEVNAIRQAQEHVQKATYELNLDAEIDYQDLVNRNDVMARNMTDAATKSEVSDVIYLNEDTVETRVFIDLQELLRPYIIERAGIESRVNRPTKKQASGIIVDARNVDFDPVVLPTVQTYNDQQWLSVEHFSAYTAQSKLPFRYAVDATNPLVIDIVGSKPALYIADKATFDTLTVHSVGETISAENRDAIMGNGKVVILVSEKQ